MCVYIVRMFKVFHLLFPLTSTFSQIISFYMVRIITLKDAMPSLLNNLYCSICMWILCKRPDGYKYTILFRNMIHVFRPNFPVWFINFILFFFSVISSNLSSSLYTTLKFNMYVLHSIQNQGLFVAVVSQPTYLS